MPNPACHAGKKRHARDRSYIIIPTGAPPF